jgi:curli biogenesis system outer membrane secretion channel CsgG
MLFFKIPLRHKSHFIAKLLLLCGLALTLSACAPNGARTLPIQTATARAPLAARLPVLVGAIDMSQPLDADFSGLKPTLMGEAQALLIGHLEASQRFSVQDRSRISGLPTPVPFKAPNFPVKNVKTLIVGDVTRWEIRGPADAQTAPVRHVEVTLYVFANAQQDAVFSCKGTGQLPLSKGEWRDWVAGRSDGQAMGKQALDLAMRDAVQQIITGLDRGAWRPISP